MLLHKHGWTHFYHEFKVISERTHRENENAPDSDKVNEEITRKLTEAACKDFLTHSDHILNEIRSGGNWLDLLLDVVKKQYLVNKVLKNDKLTDYENNLKAEFDNLKNAYAVADQKIRYLFDYVSKKESIDEMRVAVKANEVLMALNEINHYSMELSKYLKGVLPQIESYKGWLDKEEQNVNWAENNIRSWIKSSTE